MKKLSFAKASCLLLRMCLALAIHAAAQTFTILQNFQQSDPTSALVQGLDGNFYGTMEGGNIGFEGNVYTLTPGGTYTTSPAPAATPTLHWFWPATAISTAPRNKAEPLSKAAFIK